MAFYLLNCSVDTPDLFITTQQNNAAELNNQESIIEIVAEQFLGIENAIPEYADNDMDQKANFKKAAQTDIFIVPNFSLSVSLLMAMQQQKLAVIQQFSYYTFHFKIPSPPPEA